MSGVVIVGGSVGGLTAARELRAQGFSGSLTIIDADTRAPYRRPMLSKGFLDGTVDDARLALPWPDDPAIRRLQPVQATGLAIADHRVLVTTAAGPETVSYDTLIIATGSSARALDVPGASDQALTLRDLQDATTIRSALATAHHVAIIGAGFLGLEIASVARAGGRAVTVLEMGARPLERVAGSDVGTFIAALHARHGVDIHYQTSVTDVVGLSDSSIVRCSDGEEIRTDLLIAAVGSIPDTAWLEGTPVDTRSGVSCDAYGRALDQQGAVIPDTFAIGDAAAWWNPLYERRMRIEHWTNAIDQGRHVAETIVGADPPAFAVAPYFWSDQYDARIHSIGSTIDYDEVEVLQSSEEHLLVAYGRAGTLVCVTGINVPKVLQEYRPLVEARAAMSDLR